MYLGLKTTKSSRQDDSDMQILRNHPVAGGYPKQICFSQINPLALES